MRFLRYRIVSSIDIIHKKNVVISYQNDKTILMEQKALNYYKEIVWYMQGLFNNTIIKNNNYTKKGSVTFYGENSKGKEVILRQLFFEL